MPVLHNGDEFRRHDSDDYSFVTRSDRSRDFARRRRFGNNDSDDHPISQVSLPLRISKVGGSTHRSYSPYEDYSPPRRSGRSSSYSERTAPISGAARQALALCGELDESDPYYKARRLMTPPYYDDVDDEEYVIVMQRRRKHPHPARSVYAEEVAWQPRRASGPLLRSHEEDLGSLYKEGRQRKREADENVPMDFTVPLSRRHDEGLDEEQPMVREMTSYLAKRKQFAVEDDDDMQQLKNQKYQYRTRGPLHRLSDAGENIGDRSGDCAQAPMFIIKIRSHVIWEKMYVKFTCTIRGSPEPKVTWYHNMVAIDPTILKPGTMRISNQFGVHTLEIFQACLDDSGTYRVSAQNHKGEISSYATLVVRRYDKSRSGCYEITSGYNLKKPTDYPDVEKLDVPGYPRFLTRLFNKKVSEGDAVVMTCEVDGKPAPKVFWTLNGRNLDDKIQHIQVEFDGKIASVTILHAYCDDEGEYVCRAYNSCGASSSRCFLTICGSNAPPSAPTGLQCSGVTCEHLVLSWKPPGYMGHFGGAPVLGYLIEKSTAGSSVWRQANKKAVNLTSAPLTCLREGEAYFFRVRAYNRWGRGQASLPIGPIGMRDSGSPRHPMELLEPGSLVPPMKDEITFEEEESTGIPETPVEVHASIASPGDNIVVRWKPSGDNAGGFFIECKETEAENWYRVNSDPLQTTDPYPVTGLQRGESYAFRVVAVNGAGQSEPSECTAAIPLEEQSDHDAEAQGKGLEKSDELNRGYRGPPSPPRDVQCLQAKREFIEIGWIPPAHSGGNYVRYFVEHRKLGSEKWLMSNDAPTKYTQYPIGELDEGESYMFRVRCVNTYGTSPFSEPSKPILASDGIKPPNWWGGMQGLFKVSVDHGRSCVTQDSIKVCWDPPSTDGGSSVTGYYLEYRPCGGKFLPVNNKPINQRHFTVDGLRNGEFYQFRIRACNVVGCGDWKVMPGRVQAKDPDEPSEPKDVMITDLNDESVVLSWKQPEKIGDGDLIGYIVERCKEGSDLWIPCNKIPEQIKEEKYSVFGLIKGQTYFFRVRAVSQVGEGENSFQSCYVTMGEPLVDVIDRQNAIMELKKKKLQEEIERRRLREEEEKKEAFITKIEDSYALSGGQARFECEVKDKRTKVTWYMGNWKEITVKPVGKYDIISCGRRRALLVNNCSLDDVQAVHCVAEYNGCSCTADLIVDENPPVRFIRFPTDVYISKDEKAVFDCVLSKPTAQVTWRKFDDTITSDDNIRYEIIKQGCGRSLIINEAIPVDIALYTVEGLGGSCTVNLVMNGVLPVKIVEELISEDLHYTAEVATFTCKASPSPLYGDTMPTPQWYHNEELIEEGDDKYELISDGNTHTLKILKPSYEDNGEIVCVIGGGNSSCEIYVERPPPPLPSIDRDPNRRRGSLINFEQEVQAEALSNAIRLYCVVSNIHEKGSIAWYQDGEQIEEGRDGYKIFNSIDLGLVSLIISPISNNLKGSKFTCEFLTPHLTFNTKVKFEFAEGEFEKIFSKAKSLKEEEENERIAKRKERERKRQERRKEKMERSLKLSVPEGIVYDVTEKGIIEIRAKANRTLINCDVTWLKDSQPINNERFQPNIFNDAAVMSIAQAFEHNRDIAVECLLQYHENAVVKRHRTCLLSIQKHHLISLSHCCRQVFKELLLKSAEIRIQPLVDCDAMIDTDAIITSQEPAKEETSQEMILQSAAIECGEKIEIEKENVEAHGEKKQIKMIQAIECTFEEETVAETNSNEEMILQMDT